MENLSYDKLLDTVVVVLLLVGAYNSIMTAYKTRREEKRLKDAPIDKINERLDAHDRFFASDKVRLERLEHQEEALEKEFKMFLRSQLALLRHGIDGNNIQGLKECQNEINDYLVSK